MAEASMNPDMAEFEGMLNEVDTSEFEAKERAEKAKTAGTDFYTGVKSEADEMDKMFAEVSEPKPPKEGEKPNKILAENFFGIDELKGAVSATGKGLVKSVEDFSNGVYELSNAAEDFFAERGLGDGKWLDEGKRFDWVETPNNAADAIVFQTARYLAPLGMMNKAMKMTGLTGHVAAATSVVGDAAYTGLTMDPEDKRLADWVESVPELAPFVPDILVSKPDDTRLERRLKNAAEALGLGTAVMGVVGGIGKMIKSKRAVEASKAAVQETKTVANEVKSGAKTAVQATDDLAKKATVAEVVPELTAKEKTILTKAEAYYAKPATEFTELQLGYGKLSNSTDELVQALDLEKVPEYAQAIDDFKNGRVALEEAEKVAVQRLKDPAYVEGLLNRAAGTPVDGYDLVAMMKIQAAKGEELMAAIPKSLDLTDAADIVNFENKLADFMFVTEKVKGGTSEAARVMRFRQEAWKAAKSEAQKLAYMNEYVRIAGKDTVEKMKYMQMALEAGTSIPEMADKLAKVGRSQKVSQVMYELFTNGALYRFGTFVTNALGHVQTAAMHTMEAATGAALTKMGLIPGSTMSFAEVPAIWHAYAASMADMYGAMNDVFWKGKVPPEFAGKFPLFDSALHNTLEGKMGTMLNGVAKAVSVPTRAMVSVDVASKIGQHRARIHQYAARQASAAGLKGAEYTATYSKLIKNPPSMLDAAALKFADAQTFTRNDMNNMIFGKISEGVQKIAQGIPLGRIFLPFVNTTSNIADYVARRTPMAMMSPKIWAELGAGGATRAEAISKMTVGSGIMAMGAYMHYNGKLQGKGSNYQQQRAILDNVPRDNAMKLGDNWTNVENLAPIASIMLMGADLARLQTYMDEDTSIDEAAFHASAIVADRLTPEYLTGAMGDFLKGLASFEEGKLKMGSAASSVANLAETMTPFRYIYRNIGDMVDPQRRDTRPEDKDIGFIQSVWQEYRNKLVDGMGLAKTWDDLPAQYNIFGEEIVMPPGFMTTTMSPFYTEKQDPIIDGLRKLGMDAPNLPFAVDEGEMALRITMPDRLIEKGANGVMIPYKLSPKEYAKMIKFMNEDDGQGTLKEQVGQVLNSDANDEMKKLMIKELVSDAKKRARAKMMMDEPDIIQKQIDGTAKRRDALMGIGE
jgi:hypothetical protein